MKTIITLDRANQPYGYPQLNASGNFDNIIVSGLTATTNNIDFINTGGTGSHIALNNPNSVGQNVLSSIINGNVVAKWRTDYDGNINWVAGTNGRHNFLTQGDYTVGSIKMRIFNNGNVQIATNPVGAQIADAGYKLDVRGVGRFSAATDPLILSGLTTNATDANLLSIDSSGIVHRYSVSGLTGGSSSASGAYLPLSGGTVSGRTIFTSGVTANTISQTQYIDFLSGVTIPSAVAGRVFFDSSTKSISYYPDATSGVVVRTGQQQYIRAYNATGAKLLKGKVVEIQSATGAIPNVALAIASHIGNHEVVGVVSQDIENGEEGFVTNSGIIRGLNLSAFTIGDILYCSPIVAGELVAGTSTFPFNARSNQVGYVTDNGSTTGVLHVSIQNEDANLSLTSLERNILEGNVISTGIYEYTGMTQGTGQTINVAYVRGWIVQNTYSYVTLPEVTNIYYTGGTNIPLTYLNSADATYVLINSGATLYQQVTFPTPQERRENLFLGKVVHPNRSTITNVNQTVDFDVSPMSAIRDLWTPIKLINQGVVVSYYSAGTMNIQTSAGSLWGNGIGWTTNQQNPDSVSISGTSPTTFQYRSRNGSITGSTGLPAAPTGNTTDIDGHHWDDNGSIVSLGGNNRASNQRIYLFPTGLIRIQYGQKVYNTMALAIAGIDTEVFTEFSNNRDNGILIGILTVRQAANDLSDTADAQFRFVSKFGELLGGAGGISTTTLQQAYNNSATPEIVTNSAEGPLSIKNGVGAGTDNVTNLFEGVPFATTGTTSFIRADGLISGSSVSAPTISATTYYGVNAATGGTYSNGVITLQGSGLLTSITGLGGSGGGGQVYFLNLSNNQTPYKEFSPIATSGGQVSTGTSISNGVTSTLASFLTPVGYPNTILLPGGIWSFYLHSYKANIGDSFNIYAEVYKRTDLGVETLLFTTDPATVDGVATTPKMSLSDSYFSGTSLSLTDRILVVVKGTNNGASPSTLTLFTEGSQYYSYATTTFGSSSSSSSPFTGGTVSGATNFISGLTANTISAQTYQNVNAVTGGTYSNGTITLSGTGNVNGNTITGLSSGGGGITWNNAATTQSMTADNGYFTIALAPTITVFTLPSTIAFGKTLEIGGYSSGLWQLNQNSGQQIRFGITGTTTTSGILSATSQGDSIRIVCTVADTNFMVVSSIGNIYYS
jgi:hypothetical protein